MAKKIIKLLLFLVIFGAVLYGLTDILRQKWGPEENNSAQQIVLGYYEEPEHSLDVLCLGASSVRNGISELEMYDKYGFKTYSRASSVQIPLVSYYLLMETLETQDIQAVVLDVTSISDAIYEDEGSINGKLHEVLDYMPYSKYKVAIAKEASEQFDDVNFYDFFIPLYAYHDRWESIGKEDFTYREWQEDYCYKGQNPTFITSVANMPDDYMKEGATTDGSDGSWTISDDNAVYYKKIIEECDKRGIELVLVKLPTINWSLYKHDLVQEFADEQNVTFIDYNMDDVRTEIDFDFSEDFRDGGYHINAAGAMKTSDYLGKYLVSVCDFPDRSNSEDWDADYQKLDRIIKDGDLRRTTNFISFLDKLKDDNYITMIATYKDTSKYFNDDVAKEFRNLGLTDEFGTKSYLSYVAVLDGSELVYEQSSESDIVNCATNIDGHKIEIESFANLYTGNHAVIEFDGEDVSKNKSGFNVAVYDKTINQLVTSKTFATGVNGTDYKKPNVFNDFHNDPVGYLDVACSDDYITVITVNEDAGRYLPGTVNDKLEQMGLERISNTFCCPYISVLDGKKVIYSAIGEPHSIISYTTTINDYKIAVTSNTSATGASSGIMVGNNERNTKIRGIMIMVVDKKTGDTEDIEYFEVASNLTSKLQFSKFSSSEEMLKYAVDNGYEIAYMYDPYIEKDFIINKNIDMDELRDSQEYLRKLGFSGINEEKRYIGYLSKNELAVETISSDSSTVKDDYNQSGSDMEFTIQSSRMMITVNGCNYFTKNRGGYLLIYDPVNKAVMYDGAWK